MTGNPGNAGGNTGPGSTTPPPAAWYAGLTPEQQGHVQSKGWHQLDPAAAAGSIYNAYVNLEKIHGVPADRMVTWPKDENDAEGWAKVYERMGVPKDGAGYDFAAVKFKNGDPMDPGNVEAFRKIAAELRLPPSAAKLLAQRMCDMADSFDEGASKDDAASRGVAQATLVAEWGQAAPQNELLVNRAMAASGMSLDMVKPEHQVAFQKSLLMVARGMSEADLLKGGGGSQGAVMTSDEATNEINMLKRDGEFTKRYLSGDASAVKRMGELHAIVAAANVASMTRRPTQP